MVERTISSCRARAFQRIARFHDKRPHWWITGSSARRPPRARWLSVASVLIGSVTEGRLGFGWQQLRPTYLHFCFGATADDARTPPGDTGSRRIFFACAHFTAYRTTTAAAGAGVGAVRCPRNCATSNIFSRSLQTLLRRFRISFRQSTRAHRNARGDNKTWYPSRIGKPAGVWSNKAFCLPDVEKLRERHAYVFNRPSLSYDPLMFRLFSGNFSQ